MNNDFPFFEGSDDRVEGVRVEKIFMDKDSLQCIASSRIVTLGVHNCDSECEQRG